MQNVKKINAKSVLLHSPQALKEHAQKEKVDGCFWRKWTSDYWRPTHTRESALPQTARSRHRRCPATRESYVFTLTIVSDKTPNRLQALKIQLKHSETSYVRIVTLHTKTCLCVQYREARCVFITRVKSNASQCVIMNGLKFTFVLFGYFTSQLTLQHFQQTFSTQK